MITCLILFGTLVFACKVLGFAIQAAWGLTKVFFSVLFLPIIVIGMLIAGLVTFAVPLLIIGLIVVFLVPALRCL